MPDVDTGPITSLDEWKLQLERMQYDSSPPNSNPRILYCGAKVWPCLGKRSPVAHCRRGTWFGTDLEPGEGVDLVGNLETLSKTTDQRFDGIFCSWTLEHVSRPWLAMQSMGELLASAGVLYVTTHQTFPLHGYQDDYFRFSTSAMKLMATDAGLNVLTCEYDSPCTITPPDRHPVEWNTLGKAFLHVSICAKKP